MAARDDHRSIETLFRIDRGELPLSAAIEHELEHLHELCPECRRAHEEFQQVARQIESARSELPVGRAPAPSPQLQALLESDRREAEKEVEQILELDSETRYAKVRRAYKRFKTPAFVERMIEEARIWVRHDPHESLELLELAEFRLPKIPVEIYGEHMVHRVGFRLIAHQANCFRVAGDLPASEERFDRLHKLLLSEPTDDDALNAEIASLEASLRYDQRRLSDAERLLERAAKLYRRERDAVGVAKVQIQRGMILEVAGEPERAIACLEAAAAAVDPAREPQLAFSALQNLTLCLCAVDQPGAAARVLDDARAVCARLGDPTNLNMLRWAEGRVAARLEDYSAAIRCFQETRDAFAERDQSYNVALVNLDLADAYLRVGENVAVKRLAQQMMAIFAERGVSAEARKALERFHQAVIAETLSIELIAHTRVALRRAFASARFPRA